MSSLHLRIEPPGGEPIDRECEGGSLTFGRSAGSDVIIADQSMSRQHARISARDNGWIVEDLGARNGTFVNGVRIDGPTPVAAGDVLKMGASMIRLTEPGVTPEPGALGMGHLSSSIFRRVADITGDLDRDAAAPARMAARLKALNDFHRAMAEPISLDALQSAVDRFSTSEPEPNTKCALASTMSTPAPEASITMSPVFT